MSLKSIQEQVQLKYYQYELTTAVYMLEPWEKCIVNSIAVVGTGLFLYTAANYTPEYLKYFGSFSSALLP
ncbi:hypothetical protein K502DRAFT_295085 [Neoconidiobolus thromboides FSU 785]|nr:hypothetical protein K502DRAFT_295085 [Neoconidiobolus thromboides FSU 785]